MLTERKKILGIDPGFGRVGFGIIESDGRDCRPICYGCIETSQKKKFILRLEEIHQELNLIIKKYAPDLAAVEQLFFYKNVKTAIDVGQARGVILLTLIKNDLHVEELTPLQIKQSITGYGRADKQQMQKMVRTQLGLKEIPSPDDAADALAVAMACAYFNVRGLSKKID